VEEECKAGLRVYGLLAVDGRSWESKRVLLTSGRSVLCPLRRFARRAWKTAIHGNASNALRSPEILRGTVQNTGQDGI
jgi:hypothetical protein